MKMNKCTWFTKKTVCVNAVLRPLGLLLVAGLVLTGCVKRLPNDGETATVKRGFCGLHLEDQGGEESVVR